MRIHIAQTVHRQIIIGVLWMTALPPILANTTLVPVSKGEGWEAQFHRKFVKRAHEEKIDLLFIGDSITQYWTDPARGLPVWETEFRDIKAANFGINGDRIQHVLWRLINGEGSGFSPGIVILLVGTNNTTPRNSTKEIMEGLTAVLRQLETGFPEAKILLLGILPRGKANDPKRAQIAEINRRLSDLADGKRVRFLDIGARFLDENGEIPVEIMPDGLHPSLKGYEIFADAIRQPLRDLQAKP
jgi:lysophospholipase L1-like esterase